MTLDDFLTLPLTERIKALRLQAGSHDKFAAQLNTSRQVVIGWEKGAQPGERYRDKLAALSGYPADAFLRSAEAQEIQTIADRVRYLEGLLGVKGHIESVARGEDQARTVLVDIIEALDRQQVEEAKQIAAGALRWFDDYHAPPQAPQAAPG